MSTFRTKSAELVDIPEKSSAVIKSALFPLQSKAGYIFGLIRVVGDGSEARQRLAETVIEHLEQFQKGTPEHKNIPRKFEQVLQKINVDLSKIAETESKISIQDFHAIIGVQIEQQIFISGVGKLNGLFMHRTAKQRYVLYDLGKQLEENQTWEKPFLTVLDGELNIGDVFYISTKVSTREISAQDLQDILVTLPPSGALSRIETFLHRDTAYGAICFQVQDKAKTGSKRPKKINPLSSVQDLHNTKEQTEILLGEQKPELSTTISSITEPILKKLSAPGTSGPITVIKRVLRSIIKAFSNIFILLIALLQKPINLIANQRGKKSKKKTTSKKKDKTPIKERVVEVAKSLPKKSKLIGGLAAVVILIFVGTITISNINKGKSEESQTTQTVLLRIEEKKNAAEASLIYDDVEQAKTLVSEAIALLETLPENDSINADVSRLRGELDQVLSQIQGINEVATSQIGDISSITDASIAAIEVSGDVLYTITDKNEILKFNELEQTWEKLEFTNGSISPISIATSTDGGFLVVDLAKNLGKANLELLTLNPIQSGVNGLESVQDIVMYNNSLYALDSRAEQIVKMRAQGEAFDGGTNWITSANSDLSSALALTIDGDIYVLTSNNIVKFSSGKENAFSLAAVEPALTSATDMWSSETSDYLYVLEATQGRIIVFKKTGELVTQYFSPEFNSGSSVYVREEKNSIMVTTSDSVINFAANHLLQ